MKYNDDVISNVLQSLIVIIISLVFIIDINISRKIETEISYLTEGQRVIVDYLKEYQKYINDSIERDLVINRTILELNKTTNEDLKKLSSNLISYMDRKELKRTVIEKTLLFTNVCVQNITAKTFGSGTIIKYNNKFYILSAGHLVKEKTDVLKLYDHGVEVTDLKIVKLENDFPKQDLVLFKMERTITDPKYYIEIAEKEPLQADSVYILGNPMGLEDTLSDGRVIGFKDNYMHIIGTSYHGNSGGGVFNQEGRLLGVISTILSYGTKFNYTQKYQNPHFVYHGIVRLSEVLKFLKDVK